MVSRRYFLQSSIIVCCGSFVGYNPFFKEEKKVMTVMGSIAASKMGYSLIHEHILVDFIGAAQYDPLRWKREEVIQKVLPYLQELKSTGCKTIIDCTPAYLGRDILLLQQLSTLTGLHFITNTGYYGGSDNKYLPAQAFDESDLQLANRWIKEHTEGIEGSNIRPGFIKISVNNNTLSDISKKLIRAAGYCHLGSGLTIASHTGPAIPAFEQIEILKQQGVAPAAFVWVHAQSEKDWNNFVLAAKQGAWVSLDGLSENNVGEYVNMLEFLKKEKQLHRVLVSHDAGWYEPGKPGGGNFRGYTVLFQKLIPALKKNNFREKELIQLFKINPSNAFTIRIRNL